MSILEQNVQHYLQSALSANTKRSYASSNKRFIDFCSSSGMQPYPASETALCQFAAHLGKQHLKHQSIKCYLSGVRFCQIMQTNCDPFLKDMPRLKYVLRGIKLEEAKEGNRSPPRLPVTPAILLKIQGILLQNPSDFDNIMLWAAFLLCFFGFLRSGEITIPSLQSYDPSVHLNFSDIATDNLLPPNIMQVTIKASKTDPFCHGMSVYIGRSKNSLCPVSALLNYLTVRGSNPGMLFHFHDNTPLTKSRFTSRFRDLLKLAGLDDTSYAGHSL